MIYAHVATPPQPPPLESKASEVVSRHSHSGLAQPGSQRAVTSCAPRRVETPSPDGPADLETFRTHTGRPVRIPRDFSLSVVLLPDRRNTQYSWPRGLCKYAFPPVSLLAQTLWKIREEKEQILLVAQYWPTQTWFPELMLLVTAPPWQIPLRKDLLTQRRGTLWHPSEVLGDLPQEVVDTITSAGAPSTRHACALKWNLFVEWCSSHREDPRKCPIRVMLSFLQQGLERRLSPSTLKVYVDFHNKYKFIDINVQHIQCF